MSEAPPEPRPIGIWHPREEPGGRVFERPAPGPFGDHHATRRRIPERKAHGRRRIGLFGESTAAGYLYAPGLTPAGVLAEQLRALAGDGYEVVDLARTNERLASLVGTVEAALQLDLDLIVVFAGNNWNLLESPEWSAYAPSVEARRAVGEALRLDGVWGPIERAARTVLERAASALAALERISSESSVPVVVVIPEVNLADWESRQPVLWLPGDGVERWHALYERARERLAAGDGGGTIRRAREMLSLDDGSGPSPHRLLALGHRIEGDEAAAARACRDEIAACHYAALGFLAAPQATPLSQELLRRAARRHGFGLIDLPRLFAAHGGSSLPGRRFFLDYCHLTAQGTGLAMAAVTAEVLRRFAPRLEEMDASGVLRRLGPPRPPAAVEAVARFGAAIHGAHRLVAVSDRGPWLRRLCREALSASEGIGGAMLDFVEARVAPCPAVLTAAQARLHASPYRLGFQHGLRWPHPDLEVLEAIGTTLGELSADAGRRAEEMLLRLAGRRAGPGDPGAGGCFLRSPLERFFPEAIEPEERTRCAFYRSPWPESRFALIADRRSDLHLELSLRRPRQNGLAPRPDATAPTVAVELNGRRIGRAPLGATWARARLRLPPERLRRGVNDLTLRWPVPRLPGERALRRAAHRLERGLEADLHPVFGELFALRVG